MSLQFKIPMNFYFLFSLSTLAKEIKVYKTDFLVLFHSDYLFCI